MYRYAPTRNRVHRVIVEGGKAFKIEQCNLDDVAFLRLQDTEPEGVHCAYCWAGWVPPTEEEKAEEKAVADEEAKAFTQSPEAKGVPIVQSTRRMAIAALVAAAVLGTAIGASAVAARGDRTPLVVDPDLVVLRRALDDLIVQVRVLSVDINGHSHESSAPVIVVVPEDPTAAPTFPPTPEPTVVPAPSASPLGGRASDGEVTTRSITTIIVVPSVTAAPGINPVTVPTPAPTPVPTAAPTPVPQPTCFRPAGAANPCKFPHQP